MTLISPKVKLMWNMRPMRERLMIVLLVTFVAFTAIELLVYQPVRATHSQMADRLVKIVDEYRWLYVQTQEIKNIRSNMVNSELMAMAPQQKYKKLEDGLSKSGMKFSISKKNNKDESELAYIEVIDVSGKALLKWINRQVNNGYTLDNMSVTLLQKNRVKADVTFKL